MGILNRDAEPGMPADINADGAIVGANTALHAEAGIRHYLAANQSPAACFILLD